jgi:LuxR family maltose regulon positive regulatory protein
VIDEIDNSLAKPLTPPAEWPRSFRPSRSSASFRLTLTERETEVLQLIADGLINKQIAQSLSLSTETIKAYIDNIRFKLDANNRAHAASIGLRYGLIK